MSGNAGFEKRLEQLGRVVGYRASRTIVLKLPTLLTPIEGSVEMASTILPEVRAAADELLHAVDVSGEDMVIEVARFYEAQEPNGKDEPVPPPTPELISVK